MKRTIWFWVLLGLCGGTAGAQQVVEQQLVASISKAHMDSLRKDRHLPRRLARVRYGVDVYAVLYTTRWWDGTPVRASGWYMLPQGCDAPLPTMAWGHGTRLKRRQDWKMTGEEAICAFFAADGYAVAMPDYIGLGRGDRRPLYHHAETEAGCTVDMLLACRQLMAGRGYKENGQLFVAGYSQGGHTAMATHRYLQQHPETGLRVTASAPMSGAYDLAGVQGEVMDKPYSHPGYLPFLLYSYQEVYRLLPDSTAYFKAPYDTLLIPFFDGEHELRELSAVMPPIPADVLREELLAAYRSDPHNGLRAALQANTLIHWAPEAPMLLCYCKADEQVDYRNALVARDTMEALGSDAVHLRHVGRRFGHGICGLYAAIYAKMWFDSFREGHAGGRPGPAWSRFLVNLSKLGYRKPRNR